MRMEGIMRFRVFFLFAACLVVTACATGKNFQGVPQYPEEKLSQGVTPTASRPQYRVGEAWVYERNDRKFLKSWNFKQEVIRYDEATVTIREEKYGRPVTLRVYSSERNPIRETEENGRVLWEHSSPYPVFYFPLEVGKSWSEILLWRGFHPRQVSGIVAAYEEVEVPAGKFFAFRVEILDVMVMRPGAHWIHETFWYVPEVKNIVKYTHREDGVKVELVFYQPTN